MKKDQLDLLRIDLILFQAKYDHLYRGSVHWIFGFGCLLTLMLVVMSFFAQKEICVWVGVSIAGLSTLPAAIIFARLWWKSSAPLRLIKVKLTAMEASIRSPDA